MDYPRYEKVDDHNIRLITEKKDTISISGLLATKKALEQKLQQTQETLAHINEILVAAKELNITPAEESKDNVSEPGK